MDGLGGLDALLQQLLGSTQGLLGGDIMAQVNALLASLGLGI